MGYREEKENVEAKKYNLKRILLYILSFVILTLAVFACFCSPPSWKYHFSKPKIPERKEGQLRIHYIDVGQGDSTLIELPDGKVMLIDGGNSTKEAEKSILRYLNGAKIDVIDHLVITHSDNDHCGALEEVLAYKSVLNAYLPHANTFGNTLYAKVYAALLEEKCSLSFSSRSVDLSSYRERNPYTLSFLYPYSSEALGYEQVDHNDTSAILWLDYMGTSALFMGDASSLVEEKLVRDHRLGLLPAIDLSDTEILKVAHHGSAESTSAEFLSYIHAESAIISYGENNVYKHPASSVLKRLAVANTHIYQTALDGHIMVTIEQNGEYKVERIEK